MAIVSYKLLEGALDYLPITNAVGVDIGGTVYALNGYDYNGAANDTKTYGEPFVAVTIDENGDYPFFTVPTRCLEQQN